MVKIAQNTSPVFCSLFSHSWFPVSTTLIFLLKSIMPLTFNFNSLQFYCIFSLNELYKQFMFLNEQFIVEGNKILKNYT